MSSLYKLKQTKASSSGQQRRGLDLKNVALAWQIEFSVGTPTSMVLDEKTGLLYVTELGGRIVEIPGAL